MVRPVRGNKHIAIIVMDIDVKLTAISAIRNKKGATIKINSRFMAVQLIIAGKCDSQAKGRRTEANAGG